MTIGNENFKVYKHTTPSGKSYIGITCQSCEQRWRHGNGYKMQPLFYRAIQKYGWDNMKHEVLFEGLTKEQAGQKEMELITLYKTNNPEFGYNIDNGGNAVGSFSEEHIKKMIIAQNNPELIEKKRQASIGENNWFYGKKHSEETRKKMSEKARNRGTNNKKMVLCVETGECFETATQAAKKYGLSLASISHYCTGRRKPRSGLHFSFVGAGQDAD